MTGSYTFKPAIFHAYHLVYGWRIDMGYPED